MKINNFQILIRESDEMRRLWKNMILLFLVVLMVGVLIITINWTKSSNSDVKSKVDISNGGNMPSNDNNGTPPEKPDGDSSNSSTPPEKPSDNSTNGMQSDNSSVQTNVDDNSGSSTNSNDKQSDNGQPSGNQDVPNLNGASSMVSNDVDVVYYILLGIECFVISILVMYLILSIFNKKSFKETFVNKDKVIIGVLSVIILTSLFTFVSTKFITGNDNESFNNEVSYKSSKTITKNTTINSGTYSSKNKDENAILADGSTSKISNVTVNKTGGTASGDSSNFYGNNSAILAKSGAKLTLKNITVSTKADGANGVFSYGGSATTNNSSSDGTSVNISDSKITTTGDNAGGIMTTGGGVMKAVNLSISTKGTSSAAIRSDRGGGTVRVDKGSYVTNGQGSPTIYSTADISVSNAKLIAKASEGVVIEGKNSVSLNKVVLTDTNNKLNGKSTTYKNIFIYQSMSGDAATGSASFVAKNSDITTNKGDTLYVTNTKANINLENNNIINNDDSGNFLRVQKDSWGSTGSNGGDVSLSLKKQSAKGNIVVDSISTLVIKCKNGSYYEGTINGSNEAKKITLSLDKSSKIKLTGDSYVSSLSDSDTNYNNIDFNGYKLYVNGISIN